MAAVRVAANSSLLAKSGWCLIASHAHRFACMAWVHSGVHQRGSDDRVETIFDGINLCIPSRMRSVIRWQLADPSSDNSIDQSNGRKKWRRRCQPAFLYCQTVRVVLGSLRRGTQNLATTIQWSDSPKGESSALQVYEQSPTLLDQVCWSRELVLQRAAVGRGPDTHPQQTLQRWWCDCCRSMPCCGH